MIITFNANFAKELMLTL